MGAGTVERVGSLPVREQQDDAGEHEHAVDR
jgi:hypothetical protein